MAITVKCPKCGKIIQIQQTSVGLEDKTTKCPGCETVMKIGSLIPQLSLSVDGVDYQLHFGRQWVGRKSSASQAEVQIPDPTNYMSKMHAIVCVSLTPTGLKCTFEEHGKNPTSLRNVPLIQNDIVYLNVGDNLQLGGKNMYLNNAFGK